MRSIIGVPIDRSASSLGHVIIRVTHELGMDAILYTGGILYEPPSIYKQLFVLAGFEAAFMHGSDQVCPEQLSQHM